MTLALAACGVAALGLLLLAIAGPAYRIGLLSLPNAFILLRWVAYAGAGAMAIALLVGVLAYVRRARIGMVVAGVAFLGGLLAFGIPFEWQRRAQSAPPIHDITTDLENPPPFEAIVPLRADAENSLDRPAGLADQQRQAYSDIAPITLSMPADQVFNRALALAQEAGWQIVTADRGSGRIEATATTRWFGFHDDIAIRLTPWGSGTRIDMRSVSRVGRNDTGTNARRIRRYLDALQSQ